MAKSHANADPFGFEDDQQDLFNQVLDSHIQGEQQVVSESIRILSKGLKFNPEFYNKLERRVQLLRSGYQQESYSNQSQKQKITIFQQAISPTSSISFGVINGIDDSNSSSRSSRLNSNRDDLLDAESLGLGGLQFSQVPVNSFDGMENSRLSRSNGFYPGDMNDNDGSGANTGRHNSHSQTTETEEEEGVIDQGDGYKLSIMRKKRPLIVTADNEQNTDSNNAMKAAQANRNFMEFPRFDNTHNINGNNQNIFIC